MVQVKLFQSVFCYFDEIVKGMLTKITADAASLPKKSVNATAIIQIRVFRFLQVVCYTHLSQVLLLLNRWQSIFF